MAIVRSTEAILRGGTAVPSADVVRNRTRALLTCGVVAGPVFVVTALAQMSTRPGFDPTHHPISLLSQGDLGWLQITNFIVSGLLFIASAAGMRRALRSGRASTWGPRLVGIMGVALVWGGVFVADPAMGFPPGTPLGPPAEVSWHSILHSFAPPVAVWATVAACIIFARRFRSLGQLRWAGYCTATALAAPVVAMAAFPAADFRLLFAGVALQVLWASTVAARLMRDALADSATTPERPAARDDAGLEH